MPPIHLQRRDLQALAELGELGMLDTPMIHQRHFAEVSLRRCQQRLANWQSQGLTRTACLSVWHTDRSGRVPSVHCLTERGAETLAAITGARPKRFSRNAPQPETLLHRLGIVRARLAFDDACRWQGLAPPEWIHEQDRREDAAVDAPPMRQRVLYHEFVAAGKKTTCQPDAACLVQIPRPTTNQPYATTPLLLFWELDRSTESRQQATAKCAGYTALLARRDYRRYWPTAERAAVRLFWVCRSRERIESLSAAVRDEPVAESFRLAVASELTATTALTAPIWRTVAGQAREILRISEAFPPTVALHTSFPAANQNPIHLPPHIGP